MIIIEIVIICLIIYEFIMLKRRLIKQSQYYKVEPKLLDSSNMSVMSGI